VVNEFVQMPELLVPPAAAVTDLGLSNALPRLDAATARALGRLYSTTAPMPLTLRGTPHRLEWQWRESAMPEFDAFRFRLGAQVGHIGLAPRGVAALLGEARSELLPRALRYVLWADALHPLAEAVERLSRLRFEWTPPDGAEEAVRIEPLRAAFFSLDTADGFVQFEEPGALDALLTLLAPALRPQPVHSLDALRVPLPFALGSTRIRLREVAAVRAGDIVSIEEWGSSGAALLVTAELGGAGGVRLVGLAEGARITIQQTRDLAMNRDDPAAALPDDDSGASLPLDRLDAMEVSLRFEVGELSLTLGELKSIRAGHVFDLAQPLNRSPVRILAHGNLLGKGHLVAVGDRLGVRVSEFAPGEL
jgi:type III secretion protein Q